MFPSFESQDQMVIQQLLYNASKCRRNVTDPGWQQLGEVWFDVVEDAFCWPREGDATHQEDGQYHIGEQCCDVRHLAQRFAYKVTILAKSAEVIFAYLFE